LSISNACSVHAEFQLSICYPDPLRQNFDLFLRKFQSLSGKLLSEFQKTPNLNNHFYFSISNEWLCQFQLSTCYPDRLRQIFDLFPRKFQSFSRKLLSEFQKTPNLNIHFYLSINSACSCQISAVYLLPRPT
jgi:hypothetical protein